MQGSQNDRYSKRVFPNVRHDSDDYVTSVARTSPARVVLKNLDTSHNSLDPDCETVAPRELLQAFLHLTS